MTNPTLLGISKTPAANQYTFILGNYTPLVIGYQSPFQVNHKQFLSFSIKPEEPVKIFNNLPAQTCLFCHAFWNLSSDLGLFNIYIAKCLMWGPNAVHKKKLFDITVPSRVVTYQ
jgi:hypothetical protein